jgi:hypothetical protein
MLNKGAMNRPTSLTRSEHTGLQIKRAPLSDPYGKGSLIREGNKSIPCSPAMLCTGIKKGLGEVAVAGDTHMDGGIWALHSSNVLSSCTAMNCSRQTFSGK